MFWEVPKREQMTPKKNKKRSQIISFPDIDLIYKCGATHRRAVLAFKPQQDRGYFGYKKSTM